MKRQRLALLLFSVLVSIGLCVAAAQETEERRSWGFATSLQGSQLEFMVPVWIGRKVTLAPAAGLVWAQDVATDLRLGLVLHVYVGSGKIAPFVGFRGGAFVSSPAGGESATDGMAGLLGGLEYSFDRHCAVGAELQMNLTFSSVHSARFGNPGKKTLNSASALYAAFYF